MPRKTKSEPEIEDLVAPAHAALYGDACSHNVLVHDADSKRVRDVRESLLVWYDLHRRKLPWRGDAPPFLSTATHTKQTNSAKKSKASSMMDAFVKREPVKPEDAKEEPVVDDTRPTSTLPPRKVSPYETWVSEIMLQQTRVDTVVDYFLRWIDRFPTVEALANASEEDVNALWAGLGYYRRARMLHAGAKYVVENYNGELPSSTEQLLTIPGIGPYTAGAISSIAFGNQEPLVDGNVIRVVARLRAVGADPKNKQLINFSWKTARELVQDCDRPGALNQALMELGATLCTVQNPLCSTCPVRASCLAYEEAATKTEKGEVDGNGGNGCELCDVARVEEWIGKRNNFEVTRYPLKAKKNDSKNEAICVAVISHAQSDDAIVDSDDPHQSWKFLMAKRPDGGLLAGQWEFVNSKVDDSDKIPSFSQRKTHMKPRITELFASSSVIAASNKSLERRDLGELIHIFSHVKHHMGIEHLHFDSEPPMAKTIAKDNAAMRWMTLEDMNQLGITTGVRKILQLVFKGSDSKADNATKTKRPATKRVPAKKATKIAATDDDGDEKDEPETEIPPRSARAKRGVAGASATSAAQVAGTAKRLKTIRSFFTK